MKKHCVECGKEFLALPPRAVPFYAGDEPIVRSIHALTCSQKCARDKKKEEDRQRHLADPEKYITRFQAWRRNNADRAAATIVARRIKQRAALRIVRALGMEI